MSENLYKISVYIPETHLEIVKDAMFNSGAGKLGDYEMCSWQTKGYGQFKPIKTANPSIGKLDKLEQLIEYKLELVCQYDSIKNVINAMKNAHPYEKVGYSVIKNNQL